MNPIRANIPRISPICGAQGIPRARIRVAMIRSRRVSRILVTMAAMVPHPKPRMIGMTALPLSPIREKSRLIMTSRRGRYPVSSRKENTI